MCQLQPAGIGLQETLRAYPDATVWGIDLSPEMLSQSRRRNFDEVRSERLILIEGDVRSLLELAPLDLVIASHVLYFWHDPAVELSLIHDALRPGGFLALGYQLKEDMPRLAQRYFPKEGHVLYASNDEVTELLDRSDFKGTQFAIKGPDNAPEGRLALAST